MGKTPIVTTALNHHFQQGRWKRLLFLADESALYNGVVELRKWATWWNENEVYVADVNHRQPFQPQHRVVFMTYRSLVMFSDDAYKQVEKTRSTTYLKTRLDLSRWDGERVLIMDESHRLKSPQSRSFKVIEMLTDKWNFKFRYGLTGTPRPRSIEDLYSQVRLVEPTLVPSTFKAFVHYVAETDATDPRQVGRVIRYRTDTLPSWEARVSPLMSREIKKDRIDRYIRPYFCEPSKEQYRAYQLLAETEIKKILKTWGRITTRDLTGCFSYLQSALDNPSILKKTLLEEDMKLHPELRKVLDQWKFEDHGKLPALDSLIERYLEQDGEEKLVVWSGHPDTLNLLKERYLRYDPLVIHGETEKLKSEGSATRNQRIVQQFWEGRSRILFASYYVLNSSVRLDNSFRAIFFDRPWDWGTFAQSMARIFLDPIRPIEITPLIFLGTLEEAQHATLTARSSANNSIFRPAEIKDYSRTLNTEDVKGFLSRGTPLEF